MYSNVLGFFIRTNSKERNRNNWKQTHSKYKKVFHVCADTDLSIVARLLVGGDTQNKYVIVTILQTPTWGAKTTDYYC